ncbi:MAG: hypothetical protein U0871_21625 [Gemmataceae bacterium]
MRVVVKLHERVRPQVRAWRRSLSADRADRQRLFDALWNEFIDGLKLASGPPLGSVPDPRFPGAVWCPFPGDHLALVQVHPPRRVGLFRTEQQLVVIDLNFSPRPPG